LAEQRPDNLTAKEAEVHDLYQRGMSQRALAAYLGLSRSAVRDRIAGAAAKVGRARATASAAAASSGGRPVVDVSAVLPRSS